MCHQHHSREEKIFIIIPKEFHTKHYQGVGPGVCVHNIHTKMFQRIFVVIGYSPADKPKNRSLCDRSVKIGIYVLLQVEIHIRS